MDGPALACAGGPADQFYRQREHGGHFGVLYGNLNVLQNRHDACCHAGFPGISNPVHPCVGTVAAIQQETKSWKWTLPAWACNWP